MLINLIPSIKRIFFRDKNELKKRADSNPKVCMVVWNTFETDARVMKEATSLIKKGKNVTVIAVHEPSRTVRYEVKDGVIVKRVTRTLRKKNSSANTIVQSKSNIEKNLIDKEINSFSINLRKYLRWLPKLLINIRFFIYAYKEDAGIYHTHDLNTLIPSYFASRLRGAKLIYDAHEVSTDRAGWGNKWFWKKIESCLIKKAEVVITTNKTRADFFAQEYKIDTPFIIRNVPPLLDIRKSNIIREVCNIPNETPVILYQGGIQRERGLENIIRAIPFIGKGIFVFIGNGALKPKLIKLVADLKVENKVYFLNAVPNHELLNYTSSADIGLQLLQNTCFNHYSACSNKIHEYLMAGLPVICSDLPELRKVVTSVNFGLLVDPESPELIANQINHLINNDNLRQEFRKNAIRSRHLYCWEKEEVELFKIYELS